MSILQHLHPISPSRLKPYEKLCRNAFPQSSQLENKKMAICTYTALQHRSNIFLSLIQEIEISVRNEISQLIKREIAPNNDLLQHFCFLAINSNSQLSDVGKDNLKKCLIALSQARYLSSQAYAHQRLISQNISENDIIAKLTFGFWVNLLDNNTARNPNFLYWNNHFHQKLFGNRFATHRQLFNDLRDVRDFRNRLYHQDAIWSKSANTPKQALENIANTYARFLTILQKLSPNRYALRDMGKWQYWQNSLNFDYVIFEAEVDEMMKHSFI